MKGNGEGFSIDHQPECLTARLMERHVSLLGFYSTLHSAEQMALLHGFIEFVSQLIDHARERLVCVCLTVSAARRSTCCSDSWVISIMLYVRSICSMSAYNSRKGYIICQPHRRADCWCKQTDRKGRLSLSIHLKVVKFFFPYMSHCCHFAVSSDLLIFRPFSTPEIMLFSFHLMGFWMFLL